VKVIRWVNFYHYLLTNQKLTDRVIHIQYTPKVWRQPVILNDLRSLQQYLLVMDKSKHIVVFYSGLKFESILITKVPKLTYFACLFTKSVWFNVISGKSINLIPKTYVWNMYFCLLADISILRWPTSVASDHLNIFLCH